MIKNIEFTFLIVNLKPDIDNGIVYDIETFTFLIVNLKRKTTELAADEIFNLHSL